MTTERELPLTLVESLDGEHVVVNRAALLGLITGLEETLERTRAGIIGYEQLVSDMLIVLGAAQGSNDSLVCVLADEFLAEHSHYTHSVRATSMAIRSAALEGVNPYRDRHLYDEAFARAIADLAADMLYEQTREDG